MGVRVRGGSLKYIETRPLPRTLGKSFPAPDALERIPTVPANVEY
jgi:hypothetical protein